jgi:hypothetical protein
MNNIENIQEYIPTVYVNDSEPDLDETNLNKTEQAIKRVTDAANKAIDALKQLDREKLALSAISNVLSDATDKVPSLALANTMQLAINDLNSNLSKRVYYSDSVIALQSPVVNNVTYRFQVDSRSGGVILYKSEDNGLNWERDKKILSSADIQSGSASVNLTANGTTEFEVTFPKAFLANPNIYVNVVTSRPDLRSASVKSRTKLGFTGAVYNDSSAGTVVVFWSAITP